MLVILLIIFTLIALWYFITDKFYRRSVEKDKHDVATSQQIARDIAQKKSQKVSQKPVCAFCERQPLTEEHLFPDWLRTVIPRKGTPKYGVQFTEIDRVTPEELVTNEEFRKFQGHMGNKTFKVVCADCNNGWMSQIEEDAKQILTALIVGEPIVLGAKEQRILIKWAILKSIIGEYIAKIEDRAIRATERHRFFEQQWPTAEWKVWIARNNAPGWHFRFLRDGIFTGNKSRQVPVNPLKNTVYSILAVENLLVYTAYSSLPNLSDQFVFSGVLEKFMRPLSIGKSRSITWLELPALTNKEANQLKDYFPKSTFALWAD